MHRPVSANHHCWGDRHSHEISNFRHSQISCSRCSRGADRHFSRVTALRHSRPKAPRELVPHTMDDATVDHSNATLDALRASLLPNHPLLRRAASDPGNEAIVTSLLREDSLQNLLLRDDPPPPLDRQRSQRDMKADEYFCCVKIFVRCSRRCSVLALIPCCQSDGL